MLATHPHPVIDSPSLAQELVQLLENKKGSEISVLDLRGRALFTDFFLVATGTSSRHVAALARDVEEYAHQHRLPVLGIEGLQAAEWVLIDLDGVIVHLFQAETRQFYNLERLWSPESLKADGTTGKGFHPKAGGKHGGKGKHPGKHP